MKGTDKMSQSRNPAPVVAQRSAQHHKPNKPGNRKRKTVVIVILIALLISICVIFHNHVIAPEVFPSGSKINGIKVEQLTAQQAEQKVVDEWKSKSLTVKNADNGETIATFNHDSYTFDISKEVRETLRPGFFKSMARFLDKKKRSTTIKMELQPDNAAFESTFRNMSIVRNGDGTTQTKDAYVSMKNRDFKIVKEVYGNDLNQDKLKKALLNAIADGKSTFKYKAKKFYKKPKYTSTSKKILARQQYCKTYLSAKITYKGVLKDYTLTPSEIEKMLTVDRGEKTVHEKAVKKFVANKLAYKLGSVGAVRHLKSVTGSSYTVAGGNYGYSIDKKKMAAQLTKDLKLVSDVEHDAIYTKSVSSSLKQGNDIGKSYVEVNISTQMVYAVIKGKRVLSTSIVSGNVAEDHATPYGVFILNYKDRNVTLKGNNADGSDYASDVKYWMPFNGGIGFHDAPWRSTFGGSIYKNNGSHGCINMPPSAAAKLYSYIYPGIPVIVHA